MSINEKLKSIVATMINEAVEAVHAEIISNLQGAFATPRSEAPPRVPVTVAEAVAAKTAVSRDGKTCKLPGCDNTAVPRYRNYCTEHKAYAADAAAMLKGKKKRRRAKKG